MTYPLGMSPAEIERLGRQHDLWRAFAERAWQLAGFGPGQTLVDLGCGPGFTSLDLATLVGPAGRVVAVDTSIDATEYLRAAVRRAGRSNIDVVTADVNGLDLSAWRPDGVFARWLFSFLADPDAVVARLALGLRPGKTMAVMDYWNYLAIQSEPASPLFRTVFEAVHASFAAAGGSLDIAGRLPRAFEAAGLCVTAVEPFCQIGRPGSPVWCWIEDFLTLYLPTLIETGSLADADVAAFWRWWREQADRPGTLVFAPPILCVVGVKA